MLIDVWNTTVIIVRYGAIKISNLYKFEIHMPVIKLDHLSCGKECFQSIGNLIIIVTRL